MPAIATTCRPRARSANSARVASSRVASATKRSPERRMVNCFAPGMSSAGPPFTTTASTFARRDTGSRSGPRGAQAVAEAALVVDHGDLHVARERVVLQPVVAHQHVHLGMRREQRARGGGTVRADVHRHARTPRDEHRLVAEMLGGRHVGEDAHDARGILLARRHAAIAAHDHARRPAARCRMSSTSSTSGVLPVPPALMLPTTITGTGARHTGSSFAR